MLTRRSHYELAFEAFLTSHRTPFVAVEDVKRNIPGPTGIKLFDYIIYGEPGCPNYIVDVKGRKVASKNGGAGRGLDSWVTAGDLDGLAQWQTIFGEGFKAAFVFAHWRIAATPPNLFGFAGRSYEFRVVDLADYCASRRVRSPKWKTFVLPRRVFDQVAKSPESRWGGGWPRLSLTPSLV